MRPEFAEPACVLLYGPAFAARGLPLAVLVWAFPATLLSGHARWALVAAGQQRSLLWVQVAGAATTLLVGVLSVPRLGALGASLAMLASAAAVWVVAHLATAGRLPRLPFLGAALRPALVAGALLVERALLGDVRELVRALRPARTGQPCVG